MLFTVFVFCLILLELLRVQPMYVFRDDTIQKIPEHVTLFCKMYQYQQCRLQVFSSRYQIRMKTSVCRTSLLHFPVCVDVLAVR